MFYPVHAPMHQTPYMSPQTYQSPMAASQTPTFLMYPNTIMQPAQIPPMSPYMYSNNTSNIGNTAKNSSSIASTPRINNASRYKNNNRANKNNINGKRFQSNISNDSKSNIELTPNNQSSFTKLITTQIMNCSDDMMITSGSAQGHIFDENAIISPIACDPNMGHLNVNVNSPVSGSYGQLTPSMCSPMVTPATSATNASSMCSPNPYDLYDPTLSHPLYQQFQNLAPNGLPFDYETMQGDVTSYGDYDEVYDDNADSDNEQLACYVCRGRRMCFCYFLKVRYYKFPSFFDLMDHLTKKKRNAVNQMMLKNKQKIPPLACLNSTN
jgi:hypothetical protein